jgi:hypothetical protein
VAALTEQWQMVAPLASLGELRRPGVDKTSSRMFRRRRHSVLGGSHAGEEGGVGKALGGSFGPGRERARGGGPDLVCHAERRGRRGEGLTARHTKEGGDRWQDPSSAMLGRVARERARSKQDRRRGKWVTDMWA